MTTIAVRDNIMASDSLVTAGNMRDGYVKKIWVTYSGGIAGFAGAVSHMNKALSVLDYELKGGTDPAPEYPDGEWALLYLDPSGKLSLLMDKGWSDVTQPHAMGSGMPYAYAAMDMGASAIKAVEIAIGRDTLSGGKIQAIKLGGE